MSILKKIEKVKIKYADGSIQQDEILLYIEPLLIQIVKERKDEIKVKEMINNIERAIYTQIEPQKSAVILKIIDESILFVKKHLEKDEIK